MSPERALQTLRSGWLLLLLGTLLGGAAGWGGSLLLPTTYTAQTELFISARSSGTPPDVLQGNEFTQARVASYTRLVAAEEMADRLITDLRLPYSPRQVTEFITAETVPDTVLIQVQVTTPTPETAQAIAAAIGRLFPQVIADLEAAGGQESPAVVSVIDDPELPDRPSSPNLPLNVALGVLAGLFVGVVAVITRERLDRSIRDPETAEEVTGAPTVGVVLRDPALHTDHILGSSATGWSGEDYRQLRTNLQFISPDAPPRVIMVSSAEPQEGKSTLVINLASVLADAGRRVVVVDTDVRRPKVAGYLGVIGSVGLTNVLAGTADLDEVVQHYAKGGFTVIAAGPKPPNPGELLGSQAMLTLLDELRASHDYVLLDASPLLAVADPAGLAPSTDGVVLSVRWGVTDRQQLQRATTVLNRVGAKLLGVVLNIVPPKAAGTQVTGYGYGSGGETQPATLGTRPRAQQK